MNEVGAYRAEHVKGWKKETVGFSKTSTIGSNLTEDITGTHEEKVGKELNQTITGKTTIAANGNYDLSGPDIMIKGTEKITFCVGDSSIVIEASKITVKSPEVVTESTGPLTVKATGSLKMSGGDYTLTTAGEGTVSAGPTLNVKATMVKINC
jgi:hypothetical protein